MSMVNLLKCCVPGGHGSRIEIQFHWREGLKKALHDVLINCIGWNALTHRDVVLLPQRIAEIARPMLVLDHHFVSTSATLDDAMQERSPLARHPTRFVALASSIAICQHPLDVLKGFPTTRR